MTITRSREHLEVPDQETLDRLKLTPEVAWYLLSRGYELPKYPPLHKTPEPPETGECPDAVFSPDAVDKVLKAFTHLRHTQGELAGRPLKPDNWQVAYLLAPVFGWLQPDPDNGEYYRVINELYVDVPRKNGKTTISGGISVYLTAADGEVGSQVVAAASTRDQAAFTFTPIKQLVDKAPALKGRLRAYTNKIVHPRSGSTFTVISSTADAQHGANIHGAIVDELHIHKNGDLVEALETGTGSRRQPLIVFITTADEGRPGTVYDRKRRVIEGLATRSITNPTKYGVIWAAEEEDDPYSEETQRKANPGFGISPTARYLRNAAKAAKDDPSQLNSYLRLHLGIRIGEAGRFLDLPTWDNNAGDPVEEEDLFRRTCYGGLDLGSVSDLTALCWLFPYADGTEGYHTLFRFWAPEAKLSELDKRTADNASRWVDAGFLKLTPGNVTDYNFIEHQILRDYELFDVQSIGFDRWNATQVSTNLLDQGVPMVQTGQGYQTMSPALKAIKRLALLGRPGDERIHHGDNPIMRWMTDNLKVATDPAGNIKPDKEKSHEKIDGWSALANAMSEALAQSQDFDDSDDDMVIA